MGRIGNPNATISFDPKLIVNLMDHGVDDLLQLMRMSRIEANDRDVIVQYTARTWIEKRVCRSRD